MRRPPAPAAGRAPGSSGSRARLPFRAAGCAAQRLEAVEILHLHHRRLHSGAILQLHDDVDVGLEPHVPLLHDAFGHAQKAAEVAKLLRKEHHVCSGVKVRRSDDLQQRRSRAVQVNQAAFVVVTAGEFVAKLARVFLQVRADDADALGAMGRGQLHVAVVAERKVVLADLIALGQVWVVVVLAIPLAEAGDGAVERQAHHHGHFHCTAVHHWQRAGQRRHHGVHQRVGLLVKVIGVRRVGAGREHLAPRGQLDVDLQADHQAGGADARGGSSSHGRMISRSRAELAHAIERST